jgi:hypothetical protein
MKIEFKISLDPPRSWVRASVFLGAAVAVLGTLVAVAQAKVQPASFQAGDKLSASSVNKNFTDLADAINAMQQDQIWALNHAAAVSACTGVANLASVGHTVSVISPVSGVDCAGTCGSVPGLLGKTIGGVTIGSIRPDQVTEGNQLVGNVNVAPADQKATGSSIELGASDALGQRLYCCCY